MRAMPGWHHLRCRRGHGCRVLLLQRGLIRALGGLSGVPFLPRNILLPVGLDKRITNLPAGRVLLRWRRSANRVPARNLLEHDGRCLSRCLHQLSGRHLWPHYRCHLGRGMRAVPRRILLEHSGYVFIWLVPGLQRRYLLPAGNLKQPRHDLSSRLVLCC